MHDCAGHWTLIGEFFAVDLRRCLFLRTHKKESIHTLRVKFNATSMLYGDVPRSLSAHFLPGFLVVGTHCA